MSTSKYQQDKSSIRANEIHIISFSHANEASKSALKETGSCSGTSTHRVLDLVVLRMVETGVQDSGAKSPPSMIYWFEWAREENPGEDLAMDPLGVRTILRLPKRQSSSCFDLSN